jgi:large subunit ribosomal protein L22
MKAYLKNYRQAPRKVRLVANHIRHRKVETVLEELSLMNQKSASVLKKLIESAVANAKQENPTLSKEELYISHLTVDEGITYKRYMPRAFGRATPIRHECSHITLRLEKRV